MAKAGDSYVIGLKMTHLDWGGYRKTLSRTPEEGEVYIPIPKKYAMKFGIYNVNGTGGRDVLGKNIFRYRTLEGGFSGELKAQGANTGGDIYAKQFAGNNNLKALKPWVDYIKAHEGAQIKVEWISAYDIVLSVY